jgi:hypothetical protein
MAREPNKSLSRSQFKGLYGELTDPEEGGFTINVQTGERPTKGWMVSREGHEERIPNAELRPSNLPRYVNKNRSTLAAPGSNFGGWNNQEEGASYLDTSQRWSSRKGANVSMTLQNQQSMEQLHGGVGTIPNRDYDPSVSPAWKTALESGGSPEMGPDFLRRHK